MGLIKRFLKRSSSSVAQQGRDRETAPLDPSRPVTDPITPSFPDGVKVLYDCPDAIVDIVFVHGLSGNRMSTWTADGGGGGAGGAGEGNGDGRAEPWPKTLLPVKINRARILTYGYDAYIVLKSAVAGANRLIDHATNLVTDLTADRAGASSRPLIFVAHSLGGLVCKEAILISRDNPERRRQDIFLNLKGIIFMGTPHKGAWVADWAKVPASALGLFKSTNKSLLRILETDDQLLESIQLKFLALVRQQREAGRKLEVRCFFEELPLPVVGKVVSKESATFEGYDPISIHANHRDMVKFSSAEENGFKRVVGELLFLISEIGERSEPLSGRSDLATEARGSNVSAKHTKHYLPFQKSRNFVGRQEIIDNLQQLVFVNSDHQRVALVGLGGMGKTQIALRIAHLMKNNELEQKDYSVLWISAFSMASFEQACTAVIRDFAIPSAADEDPKQTVRDFFSSDRAGKWFLIVDNADDMAILYGPEDQPGGIINFLPDSDSGRILFTTRSREVATNVTVKVLELPEMSLAEAKDLLRKSLIDNPQIQDGGLGDELLQKLTCLPLAIAQASAYMNQKKVSIKGYLQLFQNTDQDMIELLRCGFRDSSHYQRDQGAVATTWIVSFNQIRDTDEDAARLLQFVACIEPKSIPRTMLPSLGSEQRMTSAIGTLCGYGFLGQREDSAIYDMHSLVHLATQLWTASHDPEREQSRVVITHLFEIFPDGDWEDRELWRQYFPHALKVLHAAPDDQNKEISLLAYCVSMCLRQDGRMKEAVELLERVVIVQEKRSQEDDLYRLSSQQLLAGAYRAYGEVRKAIKLLEHVVEIEEKILSKDDPDLLDSQKDLAGAYQDNGDWEKAIELLKHVVAIREKVFSEDHHDRLFSQHLLANAYHLYGERDKAVKLLKHVVAIREKILPEDNPDRLASQLLLAKAYQDGGRTQNATKLLQHVVRVREKVLPADHPDLFDSWYAFARVLEDKGNITQAVEMLEYLVETQNEALSEGHPSLLNSQHALARVYRADGQKKKAIDLLTHVIMMREKTCSENHYLLVLVLVVIDEWKQYPINIHDED
ncbi:unnamed protein product [Clonostachys byssicola]|uniref:NB-ARC domain-containing protein n=1 Tax=Clonostachys byssicola TaxID=160290 RepID=A0A9N9UQM0_9HYPO|nr:unnamed protein product [Clonostachys byssicola]